MTELRIDHIESPIGTITLAVHGDDLCALDFVDEDAMRARLEVRFETVRFVAEANPAGHSDSVRAYFAGELGALAGIPVDPGGTPFQQRVWQELRNTDCGETRSYKDVADAIGAPGATRAVGTANGRNPIAIVIPCHRVVNANKRLGGYAGGTDNKRWLLEHEHATPGSFVG
jgi:methylated-DNA-[protein]-cysteine S-methyltransferase